MTSGARPVEATAITRDGRELFYVELGVSGSGAPTVVFEAGMAATRSWWALVQPQVARGARTVAYDRAGLGRSPRDPQPRSLQRMADDLNDLLDHLGSGPFVLVAHSGGGPIVRAATADRPDRIAGLMLAEVTDEACDALFDPAFRRFERRAQQITAVLARLGLLRGLYRGLIARFPPEAQADLRREGFTVAAIRTRGAELTGLVAGMNRFRERSPALPDVPVTLISGALADSGMSPQIRAAANASHLHRAAQAPRGRHVIAERSGHMVPVTEPEVLVEEIRRLLDAARSATA
ncbi:alpha/beta hydrolase [Phenylobacterium sp.]|uniref:alpha/beta fold hydrolase n=1 Tax=Phenylobacterium sp. TaxID=1871053 RepID=UPI00301C031B